METQDFCSQISTIPQYLGTCWFNSILMNSFYSQGMRKLMINKVSKTWDKKNKLLKFFKTIIKKSYNTEDKKIIEMFYKTRPEVLLAKYINLYDDDKRQYLINNLYGFNSIYISTFLKKLNVKVLDIFYSDKNDKYLLNFFKHIINIDLYSKNYIFDFYINKDKEQEEIEQIINSIPDVLIIHITNMNDHIYRNIYDEALNLDNNLKIHESDNYDINKENLENIKNYKDELQFFGYNYKLDSIILGNYNIKTTGNHAISGITCNNNRYIYNGWCKGTIDPSLNLKEKKELLEPYQLIKHNWNLIEDDSFCFKPQFSKNLHESDLCFSFNKGKKFLIYVKDNKEELSSIIRSSTYSDLSSKKTDFKNFYDLKKANHDDLFMFLYKKEIIFNRNLNKEILRKILYNTLKKESGLLKKDKKYEYFTSLAIKDYNEEELIKIENNYYLKKNLFYYLFVLNLSYTYDQFIHINKFTTPNNLNISFEQIKEIIFYYFETQNIREIFNKFIKNNKECEENLRKKLIKEFINIKEINNSILSKLFVIIFGIKLFSSIFYLTHLTTTKSFLNSITDKDLKSQIISSFNNLNINQIIIIDEFIEYLISITKNISENIPLDEQIKLDNNIHNVILLFYYYIYYDNLGFLKTERKKIIFKYYDIELDNYELLIQTVLKKEETTEKIYKSNILKNIKELIDYFKIKLDNINILKIGNYYTTEDLPLGSIKGGKKKSLKRYLKI